MTPSLQSSKHGKLIRFRKEKKNPCGKMKKKRKIKLRIVVIFEEDGNGNFLFLELTDLCLFYDGSYFLRVDIWGLPNQLTASSHSLQ